MIGIYRIKCAKSNQCYIGQSVNIHNRHTQHLTELKDGTHDNWKLQEAFNTHGEDSFSFEVLMECEADMLNHMEDYYIKKYDSIQNGYNIKSGSLNYSKSEHRAESPASTITVDYLDKLMSEIKKVYDLKSRRYKLPIDLLLREMNLKLVSNITVDDILEIVDRASLGIYDWKARITIDEAVGGIRTNGLNFIFVDFYELKKRYRKTSQRW